MVFKFADCFKQPGDIGRIGEFVEGVRKVLRLYLSLLLLLFLFSGW